MRWRLGGRKSIGEELTGHAGFSTGEGLGSEGLEDGRWGEEQGRGCVHSGMCAQ